jgi:UPF0755 protein
MRTMRAFLRLAALAIFVAGVASAAWLVAFSMNPLELPRRPFDFTVSRGASLKGIAQQLANDGLFGEPYSFWILGRLLGKAGVIQAGNYRVETPVTPVELLAKLASGDVVPVDIVFVEGWTFRQWLAQMKQNTMLKNTLQGKSDADIRAALGVDEPFLEGLFFPDKYQFVAGYADVDLLRRAYAVMRKRLAEAWDARAPGLPYTTPLDALTLASIIEKETGRAEERPVIASVFVNRLRKGMRLQTDPTVIYGMGTAFDGNIRKKDLSADTPWNTYTRDGLPPTPIAMPGAASLAAAMHPDQTDFLYFVGKGDGTHQFSRTLEEHNRAVAKYQLGK